MAKVLVAAWILALCYSTWAQAGFVDEFEGDALSERWEWHVPLKGPSWSLTEAPGWLRITIPKGQDGFNHWTEQANAPLLLTAAPPGDFSVETRLRLTSYAPESNFHMALMVGFSKTYLVGWGPFLAPRLGEPTQRPQIWCEPTGEPHHLTVPHEGDEVYLRIDKTARTYAFELRSSPDEDWRRVGTWHAEWPARYIGLMGKTFADGPGVTVDIDRFSVVAKDPTPEPARSAQITVDCAGGTWPLDPMRYGHFIEHMFDAIYGGVWAEMLKNRKFTGRVGDDGVLESWRADGDGDTASFSRDNGEYYCPAQSQRIELKQPTSPVGIAQDGVVLRPGIGYDVRIVAKQADRVGPLTVSLRDEAGWVSAAEVRDVGREWTIHRLRLPGPPEHTKATFTIATTGQGTLWLGAVSLMPADNVEGFRPDVLQAMREMGPPVLRWPGGNFVSGHDWRDAIGERDKRPPRWNRAWGGWEWHDVGTDEFIRLCELINTEPYICVNCGEGRASEAAAWVEYCNGSRNTPSGALRAANGHPEPYKVKIWGIGNEIYGPWQLGHLQATQYGIKAVEFCRAMRQKDPSIKLIGVGVEADGWDGWNREVCRIAGKHFDWLSVHYYLHLQAKAGGELNYMRAIGAPKAVEGMLQRSYDIAREASGKHLPIAFDEWNVVVDNGWTPYALRDGLFAALVFNALNRLGPKCTMGNLAQIVNVIGAIEADASGVVRTSLHQAFAMYTQNSGELGVGTRVEAPQVNFPSAGATAALDAAASLSLDRKRLYLSVVNRLPLDAVTTRLSLEGFTPSGEVTVLTLTADDMNAVNTFAQPDAVAVREKRISASEAAAYTFGPHSATLMIWEG